MFLECSGLISLGRRRSMIVSEFYKYDIYDVPCMKESLVSIKPSSLVQVIILESCIVFNWFYSNITRGH